MLALVFSFAKDQVDIEKDKDQFTLSRDIFLLRTRDSVIDCTILFHRSLFSCITNAGRDPAAAVVIFSISMVAHIRNQLAWINTPANKNHHIVFPTSLPVILSG